MEGGRLHYIDVAKGLLMLMVVYGHIDGTATGMGFVNSSIEDIHRSVNVFVSFYMPCFFVITGFCGNFEKTFKKFAISSLKSILLPAIFFTFMLSGFWNITSSDEIVSFIKRIFLCGGGYWFLSALFIARFIYWVINKCPSKLIFFICITSFVLGFVLSSLPHEYEYWWFVHALCLLPYLGFGQYLKKHAEIVTSKKYDAYYIVFFFISFAVTVLLSKIGILQKDCFFDVPGVTLGFINLNMSMFIPLVFLSVFGSLLLLSISRRISSSSFLEFLGKNSLIVYCVQGVALSKSMEYIFRLGGAKFDVDYLVTFCLLLLSFIVAVIICYCFSWVMNQKYLRIAIGKF